MDWIKTLPIDQDKRIILCAYNGFGFDYRVLIHNLEEFGIKITLDCWLIDPWLDMVVEEDNNLTLDQAHKNIEDHTQDHYDHGGVKDVIKLHKLV